MTALHVTNERMMRVAATFAIGAVVACTAADQVVVSTAVDQAAQESEAELSLEIFVSEPEELNVTSAMITGPTEMMVVSGQGTKSAATRLADRVEATGLELKYIFLTHPHIDHSQGAGVLLERFPNAEFISTLEIALLQRHRIPFDDAVATAFFKENAAVPSAPARDYSDTVILIDGARVEIWKDIVGDAGLGYPDEPHVALYIPSLHALIPSDVVYFNGHVMTGGSSSGSRAAWIEQLEDWIGRDFNVVVPGHMPLTSLPDLTARAALTHTRDYIVDYDRTVAEASSSGEVVQTMIGLYPDVGHQPAVYMSAALEFQELRKLPFDTTGKEFDPGLSEEEIAEIDRQRLYTLREAYSNPK